MPDPSPARARALYPFLATAAALGLLSLMDAVMKGGALLIGAYSMLLLRSLLGSVLTGSTWLARGGAWPAHRVLRIHALRASVICITSLTFFSALVRLPLAEAIALSFISPLIALALAAILLKERVERRAIGAAFLGLAGVLVIIGGRMGRANLDHSAATGIVLVLISALFYAWNLVLQRQQAQIARPLEIVTFQSVIISLWLVPAAPFFLTLPDAPAGAAIGLACLLSIGGMSLLSWAYARAEAQALVPIEYSGFAWASLFGWLFFAEPVRPATLLGAALIIIACLIAAPRRRVEQSAL